MCIKCSHLSIRKVINRPSVNELEESVKLYGYLQTGRVYNVSDNTIRRWIKNA